MAESITEREKVFLSYASEDFKQVRKVYKGLKERKVTPWIDKIDMRKGKWMPQIQQAIACSKYFIVFLSDISISKMQANRGVMRDEFSYAYDLATNLPEEVIYILPVRLEECDRGDHRFQMYHQFDLFPDFEEGLDKLAVELGGISLSDYYTRDERTDTEKMVAGLMGRARVFYFSGEYDKALSIVESVTTIKPEDHKAWYNKGAALDRLGFHDKAIEAYNKAIEIKPDDAYAWYNKGVTLLHLNRTYEDVLEAFDKAIEIKPDDPYAWTMKGVTLAQLGKMDKGALEAFNKAKEIKPDLFGAWYNLACYYSLNKEKGKALKALRKAIEIDKGFNYHSYIRKDEALDFIRNEKEFQEIIEG